MVNYLEVLASWMKEPHILLVILVSCYAIIGIVDFIAGTLNAVFTKDVVFSSRAAQLGIMRKILTLFCMVFVAPFAMLLPYDIGVYFLSVLYFWVAVSELYSVFGHAGWVKDGNKHQHKIGEIIETMFSVIIKQKGGGSNGDK